MKNLVYCWSNNRLTALGNICDKPISWVEKQKNLWQIQLQGSDYQKFFLSRLFTLLPNFPQNKELTIWTIYIQHVQHKKLLELNLMSCVRTLFAALHCLYCKYTRIPTENIKVNKSTATVWDSPLTDVKVVPQPWKKSRTDFFLITPSILVPWWGLSNSMSFYQIWYPYAIYDN